MRSTIGLVVRRWRAEPLAVVLVQLTVMIATVLVAAVPMYTAAVGAATVRTTIDESSPTDRAPGFTLRVGSADAIDALEILDREVRAALPGGDAVAFVRTDQYRLTADVESSDEVAVELGAVVDRASLYETAAALDGDTSDATSVELAAAMHVEGARLAGVVLGDVLVAERSGRTVTVRVVELVEPIDPSDDRWHDDSLFRDGSFDFGSTLTVGPLLVDPDELAGLDTDVRIDHRTEVDPDALDPAELDTVARGVRGVPGAASDRVEEITGRPAVVESSSDLDQVLDLVGERLDAGRPVVAIVLLQVVAVALAAVGLASSIVVAGRRRDVELQQLRGASSGQLVAAAAFEAAVVVAPTVVIAPFVARGALALLGQVGPLAGRELGGVTIGGESFAAAVVVGLLAMVLIVVPSLGRPRRRSARSTLLDNGIDIVVAVGAIFAIWRLTQSDRVTGRSTGFFGADPVQVIAPALGVVAGAMLALRLVRTGSRAAQRWSRRRRSSVTHLASANLVRRPATVGRVVTVVVLAVSSGVLSVVLASSWDRSQRDRADASVSADVVVEFDTSSDAVLDPGFGLAAARTVATAETVIALDRTSGSMSSGEVPVDVVLVGASGAGDVVRSPEVLTSGAPPVEELATTSTVTGLDLGDPTADPVRSLVLEGEIVEVSPDLDGSLDVVLFVRDADGTIHRLDADPIEALAGPVTVTFDLMAPIPGGGAVGLSGPLSLVGLDVSVPMVYATRQVTITDPASIEEWEVVLSVDSIVAADRQPLDLSEWTLLATPPPNSTARPARAEFVDGSDATESGTARVTTGVSVARRSVAVLEFRVAPPIEPGPAVPAIITRSVASRISSPVGSVVPLRLDGLVASVEIVGIVDAVPFAADSVDAVLVDWATVEDRRFAATGRRDQPTSGAVSIVGGEGARGDRPPAPGPSEFDDAAALDGATVVDRWSVSRQNGNDPVALSLIGALTIAAVGALAVAIVVLALSAVAAARERRSDAAALRAIGLPSVTVRRAVVVELAPAVVIGVVAGVVTAVVLARLVLADVTIGNDGRAAVPTPVLDVPVGSTVGIALGVAVFGTLCPLLVSGLLGRVRPAEELRAGAPT